MACHAEEKDLPRALTCPITLCIMREPVMDANGITFEREAIETALREKPGISPFTNARYPDGDARLTPNRIVLDLISEFQLEKGKQREQGATPGEKAKRERRQAQARTSL
eukprot:CAMPEP_0118930102 /NCGR_PEP_ID=MMETSP1169-20130426/6903_1 /TAXON_ID=36882 /ORGANISM="Pyramimonas obovata, Strain CCMP722" /LENGTH=109 /DNA_ID=CAMNT_0006872409 /DNA_START=7 /DNA_END=333 /DNA_ORIENTATION=-